MVAVSIKGVVKRRNPNDTNVVETVRYCVLATERKRCIEIGASVRGFGDLGVV